MRLLPAVGVLAPAALSSRKGLSAVWERYSDWPSRPLVRLAPGAVAAAPDWGHRARAVPSPVSLPPSGCSMIHGRASPSAGPTLFLSVSPRRPGGRASFPLASFHREGTLSNPSPSHRWGPCAPFSLLSGRASPPLEEACSAGPILFLPVSPGGPGRPGGCARFPLVTFYRAGTLSNPSPSRRRGHGARISLLPGRASLRSEEALSAGPSRPVANLALAARDALPDHHSSFFFRMVSATLSRPLPSSAPSSLEGPLRAPRNVTCGSGTSHRPSRLGGPRSRARFPLVSFYLAGSL